MQQVIDIPWRKEEELKTLKAEAERRPDAPTAGVPEALRRIAGASGGRIVVGSVPKYGKDVPPGKKMKI